MVLMGGFELLCSKVFYWALCVYDVYEEGVGHALIF